MIQITDDIAIDESELSFDFVKSSGPGGQNVNKVATAVQLRFNVVQSFLPGYVKDRLKKNEGNRINDRGELLIESKNFRTQNKNRQEAIDRLTAMIKKASEKKKKRKKTKPTQESQEERIKKKKERGQIKELRKPVKKIN